MRSMGPIELLIVLGLYLAIPALLIYLVVRLAVRAELRRRDREGPGRS